MTQKNAGSLWISGRTAITGVGAIGIQKKSFKTYTIEAYCIVLVVESLIIFVLKWGDYVYCNSPLYDTKQFKEIGIGKWMWIKLIEYSINNKWGEYIDLMGPEGFNTFGEVIASRDKTNEPGDFGL